MQTNLLSEQVKLDIDRAMERLKWAKEWLSEGENDKNEAKNRLEMAKEWIERAIYWNS